MASGKIASTTVTKRLTYGTAAGNFGSNVTREIITDPASEIAQGSSTIHVFRTGNVVLVNCSVALSNGAISADKALFTLPAEATSLSALYAPVYDDTRHIIANAGVSVGTNSGVVNLRTATSISGIIRMTLVYIAA